MKMFLTRKQDIITIIKYLIELINSKAEIDDIDHLSNRDKGVDSLENKQLTGYFRR